MSEKRKASILSEEGNAFIRRHNQRKRYAHTIWPIPELTKDDDRITKQLLDSEIGEALATIAFKVHDAIEKRDQAVVEMSRSREEILAEYKAQHEHDFAGAPFIFNKVEMDRYKAFRAKHNEKCGSHDYSFHTFGTGLGTAYEVECAICGEKEDITDISCW